MTAHIVTKTKDILLVEWEDDILGFGLLKMVWDDDEKIYRTHTEYMAINTVIRIFKALEDEKL
jgi:hypothetical protein